ncbi:hypothetical protein PENSPDRAFT_161533 [Peniophora sp. CONT]|nr:hypothetical protein PENSPDRAFT_161533 [Peniophora sp. CONT]
MAWVASFKSRFASSARTQSPCSPACTPHWNDGATRVSLLRVTAMTSTQTSGVCNHLNQQQPTSLPETTAGLLLNWATYALVEVVPESAEVCSSSSCAQVAPGCAGDLFSVPARADVEEDRFCHLSNRLMPDEIE